MTRKEEIEQAAHKYINSDVVSSGNEHLAFGDFINGVKWADEHPILEMKEVNLEEKAVQLSQKYFPDEENIWARPNIEAQKCKSACIEMVEWLKAQKGE